jgi:hypothetical protein
MVAHQWSVLISAVDFGVGTEQHHSTSEKWKKRPTDRRNQEFLVQK